MREELSLIQAAPVQTYEDPCARGSLSLIIINLYMVLTKCRRLAQLHGLTGKMR